MNRTKRSILIPPWRLQLWWGMNNLLGRRVHHFLVLRTLSFVVNSYIFPWWNEGIDMSLYSSFFLNCHSELLDSFLAQRKLSEGTLDCNRELSCNIILGIGKMTNRMSLSTHCQDQYLRHHFLRCHSEILGEGKTASHCPRLCLEENSRHLDQLTLWFPFAHHLH